MPEQIDEQVSSNAEETNFDVLIRQHEEAVEGNVDIRNEALRSLDAHLDIFAEDVKEKLVFYLNLHPLPVEGMDVDGFIVWLRLALKLNFDLHPIERIKS